MGGGGQVVHVSRDVTTCDSCTSGSFFNCLAWAEETTDGIITGAMDTLKASDGDEIFLLKQQQQRVV